MRLRHLAALIVVAGAAAGCGQADAWSAPHASSVPVGTLGPGFIDWSSPPPPEGSLVPQVGSWAAVHPGDGYRVVLLVGDDSDPTTKTLRAAAEQWADSEQVQLKVVRASGPDDHVEAISKAIDLEPDLVIAVGPDLVDPLALVTASNLQQQFLVVGAQLPEPTVNVTAAVWPGASPQGSEIPSTGSTFDPAAFTPERSRTAIDAGVASVLSGVTGIVVWLP